MKTQPSTPIVTFDTATKRKYTTRKYQYVHKLQHDVNRFNCAQLKLERRFIALISPSSSRCNQLKCMRCVCSRTFQRLHTMIVALITVIDVNIALCLQ